MHPDVTPDPTPAAPGSVPASLTEDGFLGGRLRILQPEKGFRAGIDSVFLAAAIPCAAGDTVFEAGVGTGVAALCLLARNPDDPRDRHRDRRPLCHAVRGECQAQRLRGQRAGDPRRREGGAAPRCRRHCRRRAPSAMRWPIRPISRRASPPPRPTCSRRRPMPSGPTTSTSGSRCCTPWWRHRGTVTLVYKAEMLGKLLEVMEERFGDIRVAPLYPACRGRRLPRDRAGHQGLQGADAAASGPRAA